MNATPKRPWWHKKRWIAAAVLWLMLCWPLGIGPWVYVKERGWVRGHAWMAYVWDPIPIIFAVNSPYRHEEAPLLFRCWHDYGVWWRKLGERHREAERRNQDNQPANHLN